MESKAESSFSTRSKVKKLSLIHICGQNLVTFEELYDLKNPEEPVKVAEHKDIDDEGQTVLITERKISIRCV